MGEQPQKWLLTMPPSLTTTLTLPTHLMDGIRTRDTDTAASTWSTFRQLKTQLYQKYCVFIDIRRKILFFWIYPLSCSEVHSRLQQNIMYYPSPARPSTRPP